MARLFGTAPCGRGYGWKKWRVETAFRLAPFLLALLVFLMVSYDVAKKSALLDPQVDVETSPAARPNAKDVAAHGPTVQFHAGDNYAGRIARREGAVSEAIVLQSKGRGGSITSSGGGRSATAASAAQPSTVAPTAPQRISNLPTLTPWSTALGPGWWQKISSSGRGSQSRVKNGAIVYLVQGPGPSPQRWLEKSKWDDVSVIFLSWKVSHTNFSALQEQQLRERKFRAYYCPQTTWTTGRNQLLKAVVLLEREQGWDFEYLVFFDEDVKLLRVLGNQTCKSLKDGGCDDEAFRWLNTVLMRDRPMQAGVSYPVGSGAVHLPSTGTQCVQRCHFDHLLMAYHRTAAAFLLPYDPALDSSVWWSSAYLQNAYMSALAPQFCSYYYELIVDTDFQDHGDYPRGSENDPLGPARILAGQRLALASVVGFREGMRGESVAETLSGGLNPDSAWRGPCVRSATGVDFGQVLSEKVRYFQKCHGLELAPAR